MPASPGILAASAHRSVGAEWDTSRLAAYTIIDPVYCRRRVSRPYARRFECRLIFVMRGADWHYLGSSITGAADMPSPVPRASNFRPVNSGRMPD